MFENFIYYSIFIETIAIGSFWIYKGFTAVLIYLLFHLIASFLISIVLAFLFSRFKKFKNLKKELLVVLMIFIFMTSFFGIIFSVIMVFYLRNKKFDEKKDLKQINFNEVNTSIPMAKRKFGEGAVYSIASGSSAFKLNLLSYIVKNNISNKGSILKEALSDNNDEIRLMAFSVLSKEEDRLNKAIFEKLEELKSAKDKQHIYKELGKLYWEFIYLGIADESLRNFYLDLARDYFEKSKKDYESMLYLGKIYLKENRIKEAKELLENSLSFYKSAAIPYLAEVYFYEKNFAKVKELICMMDEVSIHPNFYFNYKVWCEGY